MSDEIESSPEEIKKEDEVLEEEVELDDDGDEE
jgi:hypothetical protein